MRDLLFHWFRSAFWRQVLTLLSGSLLAQVLQVASVPVLSRLYAPGDFGLAAVFFAVVIVFAVVINGGYETAIMLPEENDDARTLLRLCLMLALGVSLFLLLGALLLGPLLLHSAHASGLAPWHLGIPLSLLLEGVCQPYRLLLNRLRAYRLLSLSRVVRAVFQVGLGIALGVVGMGFEGLLLGFLAGQVACTGVLIIGAWRMNRAHVGPHKPLREVANRYGDFPRYAILSTWLNTAAKQLPFFLLLSFFSEEVSGFYSHAEKVLFLPVGLIGMSVSGVFYEHATRAHLAGGDALARLTRRTFAQLALAGLPLLLFLSAAGPWLFGWVLGPQWVPAGEYAQHLAPWAYLILIASPLSFLTDVRRKLHVYLYFNLAFFAVSLGSLWYGGSHLTVDATLSLFGWGCAGMAAVQLGYFFWLGTAMRQSIKS